MIASTIAAATTCGGFGGISCTEEDELQNLSRKAGRLKEQAAQVAEHFESRPGGLAGGTAVALSFGNEIGALRGGNERWDVAAAAAAAAAAHQASRHALGSMSCI
jgi:hypothetical protein